MGFLADLGMNAANSLVGGAINYGIGELTANSNMRRQRQLMRESDQYQRNLISDLPSLNKAAMQNAGLSTSMLNGAFQSAATNAAATSPAANAATAPYDSSYATSVLTNKNLKKQNDLLDEQIEGAKEDARSKRIANDAAQRAYDNETNMGYIRASDYLRKYREEHPEEDDYTVLAKGSNYMSEDVYNFNMGYTPTKLRREYIDNIASISSDTLKQAVADKQLANNEVVNALVKLPVEQFNEVKQAAQKLLNDNVLFEATKQYLIDEKKYGVDIAKQKLANMKLDYDANALAFKLDKILFPLQVKEATSKQNYDWKQLMDKLLNGDGDWKDTLRLTVVMLASFLGANQIKFLQFKKEVNLGEKYSIK